MKKIISIFLALVLCAGLCAALDVNVSAANEMEKRTVSFPKRFAETAESAEATMTYGDITIEGNLGFHCWTSFEIYNYSFVVSVPKNCLITQVTYNLGSPNRWPSVSDPPNSETKATVSKPDGYTLVVSYKPEDNIHATKLYGVESKDDEDPYCNQEVSSLTVEYLAPHTHQKDVNAYHAAVQPTCCAGNVEYWDCTYSECDAKLDANGNVIEDVTIPAIIEHSVDRYNEVTPATCTTPGEEVGVCAACGETVTRQIPRIEQHSFSTFVVTRPATCTTPGEKILYCDYCDTTFTESIPIDPNAHSFSTEWVFDKDHHWHESTCDRCGRSDKDDCLAHSWITTDWPYVCSVCGAEFELDNSSASTLSQGSIWIASGVAALAAAAVVTFIVVKKKKSA